MLSTKSNNEVAQMLRYFFDRKLSQVANKARQAKIGRIKLQDKKNPRLSRGRRFHPFA
jgi:hypothetical protein